MALTVGCGLLLDRVCALALRPALIAPSGLAVLVVVAALLTYWGWSAPLATPVVVALAVVGLWLGRRRLAALVAERWDVALAVATFLVFGAPIVLTGGATFAGYTLLGDTSVHFTLIDWVGAHGHELPGVGSSYEAAVHTYLRSGYPLGAQMALGAARPLVGMDVAWVFQPFLAFIGAMTALCLFELLRPVVRNPALRAGAAFIAVQPGLVYAYALQGSIKEVATVWVLALLAALTPGALAIGGARRLGGLAIASAASLAVLGAAVAPWLAAILVATLLALLWRRGMPRWRSVGGDAGIFAIAVAAMALPTLVQVRAFADAAVPALKGPTELGNLLSPLSTWQAVGIWPSGDYRLPPADSQIAAYGLLGVAVFSAVVGVGWLVARRAGPALLLLGASLVGSWYVTRRGSPWSDAKALMIVSPAIALACVCGPAGLWNARRRGEAMLLAAAIAAGVIWTNAVAYHDADLAPRDRLTELASIARGMAGPTLYPEFEEFAKHFLRRGDPTGPAEGRPGRLVPRTGRVPFGFPTDIGALDLPYVERFATLVLRRSPVASRPPANYRLVRTGRWYEVWRRGSSRVLGHVALGDALQPGATTSCAQVRRVARRAERLGASLATVVRGRALVSVFSRGRLPAGWAPDGVDPLAVRPVGQGRVDVGVTVARRDRYAVWIQGSFGRGVSAAIDGRRIGAVRNELSGRRQYASVGSAELGRGAHEITLMRGGGGLYPGDGGHNRLIGPLVLAPTRDQARHVQVVPTARWRSLCGQRLDWLEIVAP